MTDKFARAKEIIEPAQNILLATHACPDGDALGSILALKLALEKMGKRAHLYCVPGIPGEFSFLPGCEHIKQDFTLDNVDLVIGLDYGSAERLGLGQREEIADLNILTFDHHLVGNHVGYAIVNADYSSTAELIYEFLNFLGTKIDPEIATCILTGIYDDTGGFRHPNTNARTLEVVGELLSKGAPLTKIVRFISKDGFQEKMRAWNKVFSGLEMDEESGLIYSIVSYESVTELKSDFRTSGIANLLNSVPEAKMVLLMTEKTPGQIEACLRSRKGEGINVAKIAQSFGGGGHQLAAGFLSPEKPQEILNRIKQLLAE